MNELHPSCENGVHDSLYKTNSLLFGPLKIWKMEFYFQKFMSIHVYLNYVWTFGGLYLCLEVCYDSLGSIPLINSLMFGLI